MCSSGRGEMLIPWPNRVDDGAYEFDGKHYQLALTEPARNTAIHGLVRFANWVVAEQGVDFVTMAHRLHPHPGYPFLLDLTLTYLLTDEGLGVTTTATNRGKDRCPFGSGTHPYFKIGDGTIDSLVLRSPATEVLIANERIIPVGRQPVAGTTLDFLEPRPIGDLQLDTGFAVLRRGGGGLATVSLSQPSDGRQIDIWMDGTYDYLMIFTGDALAPERRRRGIAIEPMTCAPNAFRSGDGLVVLEPGQSMTSSWGIATTGF
jgi:aldose 1-epimerase